MAGALPNMTFTLLENQQQRVQRGEKRLKMRAVNYRFNTEYIFYLRMDIILNMLSTLNIVFLLARFCGILFFYLQGFLNIVFLLARFCFSDNYCLGF